MKPRWYLPLPTGVARAAREHMPFLGHRTCAQWHDPAYRAGHCEMTDKERKKDAKEGSAKLKDAIRRAAA